MIQIIRNFYCVYDWETASRNKFKTQPTQLAALMIEPRKLQIVEGSLFNSEIKPIFDDSVALSLGLDPVEDEALKITQKTREALALAPDLKEVWSAFVAYTQNYYSGGRKSSWNAPIRVGVNILNFDNPIMDRVSKQYGPYDNEWETQNLFHPIHSVDLLQDFLRITENIKINNTDSISLDSMRKWFGMNTEGAHDAKNDIYDTAAIFINLMKLYRKYHIGLDCVHCGNLNKIRFDKSMSNWKRPC